MDGPSTAGTNAHALITCNTVNKHNTSHHLPSNYTSSGWQATSISSRSSSSLTWQTARVWVHPPYDSSAITSVVKSSPTRGSLFELVLSCANMSHVWDHKVAGRAVVPGVLFMQTAAAAVQMAVAGAQGVAALSGVTIPAACLLPEQWSGAADSNQQQVVLRCLVQEGRVQVASSAAADDGPRQQDRSRHIVHLQAKACAITPAEHVYKSIADRSAVVSELLASIFGPAAPAKQTSKVPVAAAATSSIAPGSTAASAGCTSCAQLDALLQLAVVERGVLAPELTHLLQVPVAADVFVAPTADMHQTAAGQSANFCLASAAVRSDVSADLMVADFSMSRVSTDTSSSSAGSGVCRMIGLQARRTSAAALLQQRKSGTAGVTAKEQVQVN